MSPSSIRLGLCCQFLDAPIRFRTATHRYVSSLTRKEAKTYLGTIALDNATALIAAVEKCHELGIGAFRINSQILPLTTHPVSGYRLEQVDRQGKARELFLAAGQRARGLDIRLSFHPDQFVVLNSTREDVVASSVRELEYQASVAELVGADTLVLHGGGKEGAALERLEAGIDRLSSSARSRLALENDDRCHSPASLLPFCRRLAIPFVYDVHHHRCLPDHLSIEEATAGMLSTWAGREPYAHLSSSRDRTGDPRPHADFIELVDFPEAWIGLSLTVDVEAKAKERAVLALRRAVETNIIIGPGAGTAR